MLLERGVDSRKIRVNKSPKGKGAGDQFVAKHYPVEVRVYRSKANHLKLSLIVATDADMLTVLQRAETLNKALAVAGIDSRDAKERIPFLIPKRNIETWCHYLRDNTVNETTDYKKQVGEDSCKPETQKFLALCKSGFAANAPDSMVKARNELRRIDI